ncbi:MAG: HAMP domain-containing sensor histidine kinase [Hydrogenophaga sp.]|nr:HAMP domain-containing sensor histidine kinase [Hydrogenophaga sp.]
MNTTAPRRPRQKVLWRHLWGWTLSALTLVWLTLMAVAWYTGHHETEELSDGHMVGVARLWLAVSPGAVGELAQPLAREGLRSYVQDVAVIEWQGERVVADTHRLAAGLGLTQAPAAGESVRHYEGPMGSGPWRMVVVEATPTTAAPDAPRRSVAVLMNMAQRVDLGRDVAEHVARPALLVLPLVALGLWWTLRRGLRPLDRLSQEVAELDAFAGQRLGNQHRFREFSSTVQAINTLVDTLQSRAQREREFASDVAHELRTPLSAIALQARAAQHEPSPEHLAQLEREALRAGHILAQLLDMARAQRVGVNGLSGEAPKPVELGALASELISRHAQRGHETGHELALVQPETPVAVRVQPMLLELALRNLLENALLHTPAGTQVCVDVWQTPQAVGLSVSDDGQRGARPQPPSTGTGATVATADTAGLGLGLRLVERIAEQLGAQFLRDEGDTPMTTRFTLRWPR